MSEVWRERRDEFIRRGFGGEPCAKRKEQLRRYHRLMVEDALEDGLPVPTEVLADYPDLVQPRGVQP